MPQVRTLSRFLKLGKNEIILAIKKTKIKNSKALKVQVRMLISEKIRKHLLEQLLTAPAQVRWQGPWEQDVQSKHYINVRDVLSLTRLTTGLELQKSAEGMILKRKPKEPSPNLAFSSQHSLHPLCARQKAFCISLGQVLHQNRDLLMA